MADGAEDALQRVAAATEKQAKEMKEAQEKAAVAAKDAFAGMVLTLMKSCAG